MATNSDETIVWSTYENLKLKRPEWLVTGLLPKDSSICLYGKRGQGKTFLALDLALCIATGKDWNGHAVTQGRVAYLLAERPDTLKRRIMGWLQHRKVSPEKLGDNFIVARSSHALNREDGLKKIIASLEKEEEPGDGQEEKQNKLSLVVLDPLISFMEGFENDSRDMQKFIDGVREIVGDDQSDDEGNDEETPSKMRSVLVVHHEGKGNYQNSKGARGSSALEAGMDTVLYLKPAKSIASYSSIETTKQREHEASPPIHIEFCSEEDDYKYGLGMFPKLRPTDKVTSTRKAEGISKPKEREGIILEILQQSKGTNGLDIDQIIAEAKLKYPDPRPSLNKGSIQQTLANDLISTKDIPGPVLRRGSGHKLFYSINPDYNNKSE